MEKKHAFRYAVLFLFSISAIMSASGWICFIPIIKEINQGFKINRLLIDYLNYIYLVLYVPINFLAVIVIEQKGMRTAMIIGSLFQFIGFWLRYLMVTEKPGDGHHFMLIG